MLYSELLGKQATLKEKTWNGDMFEELTSIENKKTYELANLLVGKKAISVK